MSLIHPQANLALYLLNPTDRDWIGLLELYSKSPVGLGANLGIFHYFGPYRDAQWKVHRLGLQAVVGNRTGEPLSASDGVRQFLGTLGLRTSYRYESRQSRRDPRRGFLLQTSGEAGLSRSATTRQRYTQLSLAGIKPLALHPRHLLVGRVQLDAGWGLAPDAAVGLFGLGGSAELRGLPADEQSGNLKWLTSLEYRALVVQGLDVNGWAVRLHDIQAVVFCDVGKVGDRWDELKDPVLGVGVGVRLFGDMAGVWPVLLGLDVTRLSDGRIRPVLHLSQPF